MSQTFAIAKRELSALFFSPIAYVVLGLFGLGTGMVFLIGLGPGEPASLRPTLDYIVWLMILLVPAISMRLVSEEFRSGTIEPLMTSPVNDSQVIVGKWLGAMGFFGVLMSPLVVLAVVLGCISRPDYGPMLTGLLGLFLVGGLYLAIGTFASAATQNQIIAFLLTVFVILILTLAMYVLPQQAIVPDSWRPVMYWMNVNMQFEEFNKGLIDVGNVVYFLSGIGYFLYLAVLLLQSRRWR